MSGGSRRENAIGLTLNRELGENGGHSAESRFYCMALFVYSPGSKWPLGIYIQRGACTWHDANGRCFVLFVAFPLVGLST